MLILVVIVALELVNTLDWQPTSRPENSPFLDVLNAETASAGWLAR